jgi:hypothetical protein
MNKKSIVHLRFSILFCAACLLTQCGGFSASYTDPKTGAVYSGGVTMPPQRSVADNK